MKKLEKDKELLKISEDKLQTQILDLKLQLEELEPIAEKTESGNQTENFECNNCATGRENCVSLGTMCDMRPGGSSQVSMMQREEGTDVE